MTTFRNIARFIYNHTWINVLRMKVLRAYFRRDFKSFDANILKILPFDPEFAEFGKLFKNQLLEGNVTFDQWHQLLQKVEKKGTYAVVYRKIYSEMITKCIHDQNPEKAIEWLNNKNEKFGFHSADIVLSHGILKLLMKLGQIDRAMEFRESISQMAEGTSWHGLVDIKLLEVTLELEQLRSPFDRPLWKVALDRIEQADISGLIKGYFRKLGDIYASIEKKHMMLMDIRTSANEQKCLLDLIQHHLIEKKPFSLIRLGDGESYGLNSTNQDTTMQKDRATRERKWWGINLSSELRKKMSESFQQAVAETDVVGIPSVFRFIRDAFDAPNGLSIHSIKPKTTYRGIQMIIDDIDIKIQDQTFDSSVVFTENRCHQVVFTFEQIKQLGKHASKVLIVSHYDPAALKRSFTGLSVEAVQIPKERLGEQSLPFKIDEFDRVVSSFSHPGTLVLIAAGFAGKHFLQIAKNRGAVAVDVGAMADYWLGFHTRQVVDLV